jgi:hypothetical protein
MRDPEIDDAEWQRVMSMTEAQIDAEWKAAESEYTAFLKAMSRMEEYRYWRRYILTSIMANRRRLRDPSLARIEVIDKMFRDGIRKSQLSLLKWREHLRTGVFPGTA